jgi:16S rRNA (adenine1518-N6/adenine1519-N6)-dimethyltransferase
MTTLTSPKQLLLQWNLRPKHHFGQNFLSNPELIDKIARQVVQGQAGTVIEIGAGLGALTASLLTQPSRVIAIERDRELIPVLRQLFSEPIEQGKLTLLEEDAKTAQYSQLFEGTPKPHVLTGNLPYQLTGPLLRRAVELSDVIERAVFMVQLEVADRLCSQPSQPEYGALTVFVQACYSVRRVFTVGKGAFYPQPRVDSAIVELVPLCPRVSDETPLFRELVQRAFQQRRKMLRNAWSGLPAVSATELQDAATQAGIDLNARGETLSVSDFARMASGLTS